MTISMKIMGAKKVNSFLVRLRRNTGKEITKAGEEFSRFVQRSAKRRAPRDTGDLARSITVKKGKKTIEVIVNSPYGIFQEEGFRPHWIHADMVRGRAFREGFIFVRRYTPFIKPALEMGLNRLPMLVNRAMEKAIIKSKR